MEIDIIFGRIGSYGSEPTYTVDYMSENGTTHRDKISQTLYQKLKQNTIEPLTTVIGIFDIDIFNKLTLIDIKL